MEEQSERIDRRSERIVQWSDRMVERGEQTAGRPRCLSRQERSIARSSVPYRAQGDSTDRHGLAPTVPRGAAGIVTRMCRDAAGGSVARLLLAAR